MALSLQTKLFTIFLIPVIIWEIFTLKIPRDQNKKHLSSWNVTILWLISLGIGYVLISVWYRQFGYHEQLIFSHLKQSVNPQVENFNNFQYILYMTRQDYDYIF